MDRINELDVEYNEVGTTSSVISGHQVSDEGPQGLNGISSETMRHSSLEPLEEAQSSAGEGTPIRNGVMKDVSACMTGFREKAVVKNLTVLIKMMGGVTIAKMDTKVTHLICNRVGGYKYKYAKTFGIPVLRSKWVFEAWKRRDTIGFSATNEAYILEHKLLPFEGRKICFFGFPNDERGRMEDFLNQNGGISTDMEEETCFHMVVPNEVGAAYPSDNFGELSPIVYEHPLAGEKKDDNLAKFNDKSSSIIVAVSTATCTRKRKINSPMCSPLHTESSSTPYFKTPYPKVYEYERKCKPDTPRPIQNTFLKTMNVNSTAVTSSIDYETLVDQETIVRSDFSMGPTSAPVSTTRRHSSSSFVEKHIKTLSEFIKLKPNGIILKADWFWNSIERTGFVDDQEYLVALKDTQTLNVLNDPPNTSPLSSTRNQTMSEDILFQTMSMSSLASSKQSMRFNYFTEFLDTETKYVGFLDEIVHFIKKEIEDLAGSINTLLTNSQIREIFKDFLPIFEVHQRLLDRLNALNDNWNDECLIGQIIIELKTDIMQAYAPYFNNFDNMKSELMKRQTKNERFRTFLYVCQGRHRCDGHHFKDMIMFPIQRLPRIELLLKAILKPTWISHPDHMCLKEAIQTIHQLLNDISSGKSCATTLQDVFRSIQDCPSSVLNNGNRLVSRCQVKELGHRLAECGTTLTLFTFSDRILVCKRRSHLFSSHSFKYMHQILLNDIRWIMDITDKYNVFALVLSDYKKYTFSFVDEHLYKSSYLTELTDTYAKCTGRTDKKEFFQLRKLHTMNLSTDSDLNTSKFKKFRNSFYKAN